MRFATQDQCVNLLHDAFGVERGAALQMTARGGFLHLPRFDSLHELQARPIEGEPQAIYVAPSGSTTVHSILPPNMVALNLAVASFIFNVLERRSEQLIGTSLSQVWDIDVMYRTPDTKVYWLPYIERDSDTGEFTYYLFYFYSEEWRDSEDDYGTTRLQTLLPKAELMAEDEGVQRVQQVEGAVAAAPYPVYFWPTRADMLYLKSRLEADPDVARGCIVMLTERGFPNFHQANWDEEGAAWSNLPVLVIKKRGRTSLATAYARVKSALRGEEPFTIRVIETAFRIGNSLVLPCIQENIDAAKVIYVEFSDFANPHNVGTEDISRLDPYAILNLPRPSSTAPAPAAPVEPAPVEPAAPVTASVVRRATEEETNALIAELTEQTYVAPVAFVESSVALTIPLLGTQFRCIRVKPADNNIGLANFINLELNQFLAGRPAVGMYGGLEDMQRWTQDQWSPAFYYFPYVAQSDSGEHVFYVFAFQQDEWSDRARAFGSIMQDTLNTWLTGFIQRLGEIGETAPSPEEIAHGYVPPSPDVGSVPPTEPEPEAVTRWATGDECSRLVSELRAIDTALGHGDVPINELVEFMFAETVIDGLPGVARKTINIVPSRGVRLGLEQFMEDELLSVLQSQSHWAPLGSFQQAYRFPSEDVNIYVFPFTRMVDSGDIAVYLFVLNSGDFHDQAAEDYASDDPSVILNLWPERERLYAPSEAMTEELQRFLKGWFNTCNVHVQPVMDAPFFGDMRVVTIRPNISGLQQMSLSLLINQVMASLRDYGDYQHGGRDSIFRWARDEHTDMLIYPLVKRSPDNRMVLQTIAFLPYDFREGHDFHVGTPNPREAFERMAGGRFRSIYSFPEAPAVVGGMLPPVGDRVATYHEARNLGQVLRSLPYTGGERLDNWFVIDEMASSVADRNHVVIRVRAREQHVGQLVLTEFIEWLQPELEQTMSSFSLICGDIPNLYRFQYWSSPETNYILPAVVPLENELIVFLIEFRALDWSDSHLEYGNPAYRVAFSPVYQRAVEFMGQEHTPPEPGERMACAHCSRRVAPTEMSSVVVGHTPGPTSGMIRQQMGNQLVLWCAECAGDTSNVIQCISCDANVYRREAMGEARSLRCPRCHSMLQARTQLPQGPSIRDYHRAPREWHPRGKPSNGIFYGVELEVVHESGDTNQYQPAADALVPLKMLKLPNERREKEWIIVEYDGSLRNNNTDLYYGFEVIFHPVSPDFAREHEELFGNVLDTLTKNKMISYQSVKFSKPNGDLLDCGIHISVTRDSVPTLAQFKLQKLFYENPEFIGRVSRRKKESLEHWARVTPPETESGVEVTYAAVAKDKVRTIKYMALNFKSEVIEMRIFRGTLKLESMMMNLQFAQAAVEFCMNLRYGINDITLPNFLRFVCEREREFIELGAWLRQKRMTEGYC